MLAGTLSLAGSTVVAAFYFAFLLGVLGVPTYAIVTTIVSFYRWLDSATRWRGPSPEAGRLSVAQSPSNLNRPRRPSNPACGVVTVVKHSAPSGGTDAGSEDSVRRGRTDPAMNLKPRPEASMSDRRRRLNERLRAEYIAGAEQEWRKRTGRPMTAKELDRVPRRYPGDA